MPERALAPRYKFDQILVNASQDTVYEVCARDPVRPCLRCHATCKMTHVLHARPCRCAQCLCSPTGRAYLRRPPVPVYDVTSEEAMQVASVLEGYNGTVMCYGQTGAGASAPDPLHARSGPGRGPF